MPSLNQLNADHEATHAVVAARMGANVKHINTNAAAGPVRTRVGAAPRAHLVATLAGVIAEQRAAGAKAHDAATYQACRGDLENALRTAREIALDELSQQYPDRCITDDMVREETARAVREARAMAEWEIARNQPAIKRVSKALQRRGSLTASEFLALDAVSKRELRERLKPVAARIGQPNPQAQRAVRSLLEAPKAPAASSHRPPSPRPQPKASKAVPRAARAPQRQTAEAPPRKPRLPDVWSQPDSGSMLRAARAWVAAGEATPAMRQLIEALEFRAPPTSERVIRALKDVARSVWQWWDRRRFEHQVSSTARRQNREAKQRGEWHMGERNLPFTFVGYGAKDRALGADSAFAPFDPEALFQRY